ncbi:MAG TPA: helix-turn-helix domain-containing protein [Ktedonobacterales bacterium]|nr:helix-turn-helix domain-containing protein [Ktedonobacterales bacterium]
MATDEFAEYISIAEAAEKYKVTRTYWYDQMKAGKLIGYELPGRRGTYLLRADVEAFWKPRPKVVRKDDAAGA